jgi:hypothetical protein
MRKCVSTRIFSSEPAHQGSQTGGGTLVVNRLKTLPLFVDIGLGRAQDTIGCPGASWFGKEP